MTHDLVYAIDADGFLLSAVRKSFLGPGGVTVQRAADVAPPDAAPPPGFAWRWAGAAWELARLAAEPEPAPAAPVYVEQRRTNYPPISAQLDMLWHAMDRGEIPMAEDFYNSVAAVKDAFPKDKTGETVFEVGKMPGT